MRRSGQSAFYEAMPSVRKVEARPFSGDQRIVRFGIAVGGLFSLVRPRPSATTAGEIFVEVVPHGGNDGLFGPQEAKRVEGLAEDSFESTRSRRHVLFSAGRALGLSGLEKALF